MADTAINTPSSDGTGAAGMVVALIALVAIVVGGLLLFRYGGFAAPAQQDGTNINVTLPAGTGGTGDTGTTK